MVIKLSDTQSKILAHLLHRKYMTRMELCERMDLSRTTVYDNLVFLRKLKIVEKLRDLTGEVGRPKVLWFINNHEVRTK